MSPWEWLTTTLPAGAVASGVGVGAFVLAILTDKLMTQAQHLRRVSDIVKSHDQQIADLKAHHEREIAEKNLRIADIAESRDGWKEAARLERERADRVTEAFSDVANPLAGIQHVLESLDRALPPSPVGGHA